MGSQQNLDVVEPPQVGMTDDFQPLTGQPGHFVAVVDDVTQTVETARTGYLLLGFPDSGCHAETESGISVNLNLCHCGPGRMGLVIRYL